MADVPFEAFERLLAMIEGRFGRIGRPAATIIVAVGGLAFFAFCVNHLIDDGIIPLWRLVEIVATEPKSVLSIIFRFLFVIGSIITWLFILPLVGISTIYFLITRFQFMGKAKKIEREAAAFKEAYQIFFDSNEKAISTINDAINDPDLHSKEMLDTLERLISIHKTTSAKLKSLLSKFLPEPPHPDQEQPSTPEKT